MLEKLALKYKYDNEHDNLFGYVLEHFEYDEGDKTFPLIRIKTKSRHRIGDRAGSLYGERYAMISIGRRRYSVGRMVYLFHFHTLPELVKHKDGDTTNNLISNLLPSTFGRRNLDSRIKARQKNNTSGISGIHFNKSYQRWYVRFNNKHIAIFDTMLDAAACRRSLESKYLRCR